MTPAPSRSGLSRSDCAAGPDEVASADPNSAATSLAELIGRHAAERGTRVAFRFLPDGETEAKSVTYAALDRQSRAVGASLQRIGRPGDRVMVLAEDGIDFIRSFLACLYAGMIAVPVAPPMPVSSPRRMQTLRSIALDSQTSIVMGMTGRLSERIRATVGELAELPWLATEEVREQDADQFRPTPARPDDVCFLQYTSGSTSAPKGVMVTHRSLLANQHYLSSRMGTTADDVIVCWLPLFHDAGLIVNVLQTLYLGAQAVLMPPLAFVQRPERWLRAIGKYRATMVGAPNFAYDLCVRRIPAEQRASLDLSSLRLAFNAAEPVRASTITTFSAAFAPARFDPAAMWPCYGLAEITVFGVGPEPGEGPTVLEVELAALQQGHLRVGGDHAVVASGSLSPPRRLLIVDPQTRQPLEEDTVGEIWLAGGDVAAGYWNRPEETAATFQARTCDPDDGPFLRTGDLGVLHEGRLFVTGRLKDLIIIGGRNHYPQDIELTVQSAHPWIRPDCVAAFGWERDDEERLLIVAEVLPSGPGPSRPDDPNAQAQSGQRNWTADEIRQRIRNVVSAEHGVGVEEVLLVVPGSVPKTSSGKVQRQACRADFAAHRLRIVPLPDPSQPQEMA